MAFITGPLIGNNNKLGVFVYDFYRSRSIFYNARGNGIIVAIQESYRGARDVPRKDFFFQ